MHMYTGLCIDGSFSSYEAREGLSVSHLTAVLPVSGTGFTGSSKPEGQAQHSSRRGFSYLLVPLESS